MDKPEVTWKTMEQATKQDFEKLMLWEADYNTQLVDRLLDQLRMLDESWTPYPINRYQHSLQSATRAYRDGADDETIVAALLHDLGDIVAPYNHGEVAAAILKPYVSEKTYWILKHHGIFQGYYYNHHLGGDRYAREAYRDSPYYDACVYFCHHYDQVAFDPDYQNENLTFFEPIVRRVLAHNQFHLELTQTRDANVG